MSASFGQVQQGPCQGYQPRKVLFDFGSRLPKPGAIDPHKTHSKKILDCAGSSDPEPIDQTHFAGLFWKGLRTNHSQNLGCFGGVGSLAFDDQTIRFPPELHLTLGK
jgi:hypothetical protein